MSVSSSKHSTWRAFITIHYDDVIMGAMASQITSLAIVHSTVYSGADQSKHQSSASLAFVWGIYRGPVNSPHKWSITRKMFLFDDVNIYWIAIKLSYVIKCPLSRKSYQPWMEYLTGPVYSCSISFLVDTDRRQSWIDISYDNATGTSFTHMV